MYFRLAQLRPGAGDGTDRVASVELCQSVCHGLWILDHEKVAGAGKHDLLRIREPFLDESARLDEAGHAVLAEDIEPRR